MRSLKKILALAFGFWFVSTSAFAYYNPKDEAPKQNNTVKFREECTTAKRQTQQDVNNVRATLTTGGDVWWDRGDGKYVVPKVEPGQTEVSSIFAGAVWLGGIDPGGNLKVACQQYGNNSNQSDFWTGPLTPDGGSTSKDVCDRWDRFFEVTREEIEEHLGLFAEAEQGLIDYTPDMIPSGVRGWPAKRNPYFFSINQFDLPDTDQGLAGFWDEDGDGFYDPLKGDFPVIEIRGCEEFPPQYPDQMIFWIYNDEGGGATHGETNGFTIRMEVQVQAFAYATNDQINDMTFQRYKLINRAKEDIDSTYFAMWVDADLGCSEDDFIGCDIDRSLAYTYNADAEDGNNGTICTVFGDNVPTYGTEIPIIGIDYFRGPLDENREELGMSSFTYINRAGSGTPPPDPGTTDPTVDIEFYRYLSGSWRNGEPFTFGDDAYNPGSNEFINYAFVDDPDDANGWSMCTASLPLYDRRTVQASGPFILQPGAVNELIIGAVWVPNIEYPCPDISRLQDADDIAQDLFDNCFDIVDGPDAPDIDWIELDQELIAVFTNDPNTSNNYLERYEEVGIGFPEGVDSTYNFEGYLLYQLAGPLVGTSDFDDPTKARLIYQVDVKNGIATLYNWEAFDNPGNESDPTQPEFVYFPEVKVEALDQGIRHTFTIQEDQFATGDRRLINHRKYYFSAKAYAHNNYEQFDPLTGGGQRVTYLEGRRNIRTYSPIPRPIVDRDLMASYGDGAIITRIDGVGVGGNFVDISDETRAKIENGSFDGEIIYKDGRGPIDVTIYNPLDVVDGEFELTFVDENMGNDELDNEVYWQLRNLNTNDPAVLSDTSIASLNEQIFGQYGFSISIGQTDDVGDWADETDGAIGYEQTYADLNKPFWFSGIPDGFTSTDNPLVGFVFDYVRHKDKWQNRDHEVLATIGPGYFVPYMIADWEPRTGEFPYLSPAWKQGNANLVNDESLLSEVKNIDIVFTSNKDLWSRCVVVEMMTNDYSNFAINEAGESVSAEGGNVQFDLRAGDSVGKDDSDGDGLPDKDGDGIGMGWFPGYAIDVENGQRLNIFFGENSAYREETGYLSVYPSGTPTGGDMMFNPTSDVVLNGLPINTPLHYYAGGQHFIYVTNEPYDSCAYLRTRFDPEESSLRKVNGLKRVIWAGLPILQPGTRMESYSNGLIPNDAIVKLRVDNPYSVETGTGEFNGYPSYRFKIEGKQAAALDAPGVEAALDMINVVPNPYYAFSDYEDSRVTNIVKITNLPAKCVVTIYSLDGKFIRQYNRDEQMPEPVGNGIPSAQIIPDIEWDLKNSKGIPIAAGVYLIHVDAPGLGERTLKWFGVTRLFDPSGSN